MNFTRDWNCLLSSPICPFCWYDYVGDAPLEYSGTGSAQQHNSASPEIGLPKDPPADTSVVTDVKPTPDINHAHGGMDPLISSTVSQ